MIADIRTLEDVATFTKCLVEEGTNAHPDEDFNNYINIDSGAPAYTAVEADVRNRLMNKCFDICEAAETSIYDIMQEVFLIETGMDKYIPLPSHV